VCPQRPQQRRGPPPVRALFDDWADGLGVPQSTPFKNTRQ
jgi:hypothetical protein